MSGAAAPQVSQLLLLLLLLLLRTAADANACVCYAFTLTVRALTQPSPSAKVTKLTVHPIHESRLSLLGAGQPPPSTSTTPTRQQVDNEGRVHQPPRSHRAPRKVRKVAASDARAVLLFGCCCFFGRGGVLM